MDPDPVNLGRAYGMTECPNEILRNENILKKVPRCQAIMMERMVHPEDPRPYVVHVRWTNKICFQCHRKGCQMKLYACPSCQLAFYCSSQCFEQHQPIHRRECGNVDIPVDQISYGGQIISFTAKGKT
jgi:hypothetical protein